MLRSSGSGPQNGGFPPLSLVVFEGVRYFVHSLDPAPVRVCNTTVEELAWIRTPNNFMNQTGMRHSQGRSNANANDQNQAYTAC